MKKTKILSKCCVCRKIKRKKEFRFTNKIHMDQWGHYQDDLKDLHNEFDVVYSHGYCPECVKPIIKEIETLKNIRYRAFDKVLKF